jgi:hypothetical protein
MLTKTLGIAILIGAAGAFVLGVTPPPSVAATIFGAGPTVQMERDTNVKLAAEVKKKGVIKKKKRTKPDTVTKKTTWIYSSKRHGQRHKHRNGQYAHYYGGYYYQQPWWTLSAPGIGICVGC